LAVRHQVLYGHSAAIVKRGDDGENAGFAANENV
jgi:hypothetical protein